MLDEFLNTHGEKLFDDPLKAAILQRDLWFAFYWANRGNPTQLNNALGPARLALQPRLAKVIGRLALTPAQIAALPDAYAASIRSGRFPIAYDSAQPTRAFLPDDLLSPTGPWVAVTAGGSFAAGFHTRDFGGRYALDLFMNLPGGRAATIDHLQKIAALTGPNPAAPPLPRGSQLALLRRPLLIDTDGKLRSTSLIESVQMRIFRPEPRATLPAANRGGDDGETDFFEIVRSRAPLFAGEAGGLRAVTPDEKGLPSPIRAHMADYIQQADRRLPGERARTVDSVMRPILNQCLGCHKSGRLETKAAHLAPLEKGIFDVGGESVIQYKVKQNDWRDLLELMKRE